MNKSQFNDILNYIKNRPTEAARLREALGIAASGRDEGAYIEGQAQSICKGSGREIMWVTAAEAGRCIDKSAKWVRDHIGLFPSAFKSWKGCGRFTWMFDKNEVITNYLEYIQYP